MKTIDQYIKDLSKYSSSLDKNEIICVIKLLAKVYKNGGNIYIFGNGGSALNASHFAVDLNKGASMELKKEFKAISLTDSIGSITAYANDISYEDIFSEQLKRFLKKGDVVIAISVSGNSKNVIKAVTLANSRRNTTIGLTGKNGGVLKGIAKFSISTKTDDMQICEDLHAILAHLISRCLNEKIKSDEGS